MIPEEIKKHRPKNTEIHVRGDKYYVYKITSKYDPETKKSKKKTLGCIGKITLEDGFIPNKSQQKTINIVSTKEFGASSSLLQLNEELIKSLKKVFPDEYKRILTIAILRIISSTPLSSIKTAYEKSVLSDVYTKLPLSKNSIGSFLDYLGNNRPQIITFLKENLTDNEELLFDGTSLFTDSKNMEIAKKGYNNNGKSKPQVNLLYAFCKNTHTPTYYRLLPGNIGDKKSFMNTVEEMGVKNCIIVADKGFNSKENIGYLKENNLRYIIPIKSNSKLLKENNIFTSNEADYDGYFLYHKRPIWYLKTQLPNNDWIYSYLDPTRRVNKKNEFLSKASENYDSYSMETYNEKSEKFGIFSYQSNLDESSKSIYETYKARWEIEVSFNNLKNNLELGTVNVSSQARMEGLSFLNHISLLLYYSLINSIKEAEMNKKYSTDEILTFLKTINIVCIDNDKKYLSEITSKESQLIKSLGIDMRISQ